jgi:hypothetical protein
MAATILVLSAGGPLLAADTDFRGTRFIWFTNLASFNPDESSARESDVFTSPELSPQINWDELIVSWNADMPSNALLTIEARPIYADARPAKFYTMGVWSGASRREQRHSVLHQKDENGDVSTDTLILNQPAQKIQMRVSISDGKAKVKFLGLCFTDTKAKIEPLEPNREAWDKTIPVPERSQMAYPNGGALCSPTSVSMLMTYWSKKLNRSELDHDVPDIVKEVYDENWHGTGNWPFNTAYAGSYPGIRGYVTRLSDVSELEDWVAKGLPVALSLCYDRLRGKGPGPNGHLVVFVGFTKEGDVIINDPGTSKHIRKTFPRKNLIYAWANSKNAAYLIYPESAELPTDRFGHWASQPGD